MTITLDSAVVQHFRAAVPAKLRSQYIEDMLRKALRGMDMEGDYEAMANDPESHADGEFYKQFAGDVE